MNRIRELRKSVSAKQADLYRWLKWKQSRLTNYKRGARTPGPDEARRIVHALNVLGVARSMADVFPEPETGAERLVS